MKGMRCPHTVLQLYDAFCWQPTTSCVFPACLAKQSLTSTPAQVRNRDRTHLRRALLPDQIASNAEWVLVDRNHLWRRQDGQRIVV